MIKQITTFSLFLILFWGVAVGQSPIPAFEFTDLEGKSFNHENLDQDLPAMIMLFDPYCDHCEQQATWIAEAADKFQDVQFVFVTIEPEKEPIANFRDKFFGESSLAHVYFLQDLNFAFESYFGYTDDAVNIYLYKPGAKKLKYFGHEQQAETLLKFL